MTVRERVAAAVGDAAPGAGLVVALGGGADSAVLAWGAVEMGRVVRSVFVDHGLPGSSALGDAAERLASRLGIQLDVLPGAVGDGPDLENRCRDVRRRLLLEALAPGEVLLLGHTQTDQAETVLLNLVRGAGARGLSGMQRRSAPIERPLLDLTREETASLAMDLGLPFAADPANDDPRFLRNRVRSEVLPILEALRPGAVAGLARSAEHLAADDRLLDELAVRVSFVEDGSTTRLPADALAAEDEAVAARVVLRALGMSVTARDVDAVLRVARGGVRRLQLSAGRFAEREADTVVIWATEPGVPAPARLPVPGSVRFGAHRIRAEHVSVSPTKDQDAQDLGVETDVFDVRAVEDGDRIDIGEGSKLVRDALMEAAVPRRLRASWPVLLAGGYIAAVPGIRVAAWARPAGSSRIRITSERSAS